MKTDFQTKATSVPLDAVALLYGHSLRAIVTLEGLLEQKKTHIDRVPFSDFGGCDLIPRSQICHDRYLKDCQPKAPHPGCTGTFISKKLRREMFAAVRTRTGKAPPITIGAVGASGFHPLVMNSVGTIQNQCA